MFDKRNNLSHQVVEEIKTHFKDKVFSAVIPRNVRLSEAPSHGVSIFGYDPRSIGAIMYLELAKELVSKSESVEAGLEAHATTANDQLGAETTI
jgi:chromosome partitioning protein